MIRNSSPASRYSCKHSLSSRESDLRDPCQPTAYPYPKAEDGNRRKSVLQRARRGCFPVGERGHRWLPESRPAVPSSGTHLCTAWQRHCLSPRRKAGGACSPLMRRGVFSVSRSATRCLAFDLGHDRRRELTAIVGLGIARDLARAGMAREGRSLGAVTRTHFCGPPPHPIRCQGRALAE
jgi:hypothetical protein